MIKALTLEKETHEQMTEVIQAEKNVLEKAVNLDTESITMEDIEKIVRENK